MGEKTSNPCIHGDETTVPVLREAGGKAPHFKAARTVNRPRLFDEKMK